MRFHYRRTAVKVNHHRQISLTELRGFQMTVRNLFRRLRESIRMFADRLALRLLLWLEREPNSDRMLAWPSNGFGFGQPERVPAESCRR
jgi:hypothetical protein